MSDVAAFISEIETMYRREYKDEENSFIRDRLFKKEYVQKVLIRALEELERIDSDYLPSPKKVLATVEKAHYDMTPKKANQSDNIGGDTSRLQFNIAKVLRNMIFSGDFSRQDILDKVREGDKTKPGTGWDKCGMALERYYSDSNFNLSKPPSNFIMEDT